MTEKQEKQILQSWDSNAAAWTESIRTQQIESRKLATDKAILDAVTSRNPASALDVGCGEGWLVRALSQRGIKSVGTDGAAGLIEAAKESGDGTFHVLTYEDLLKPCTVSEFRYDAIICNFALIGESVVDLLSALRKLLEPNGTLFIQTLHPFATCGEERYQDAWRLETFSSFGSSYKEPMPWYFRTVGSWLNAVNKAGLHVDRCSEPLHPTTGKPLSLLLECKSS